MTIRSLFAWYDLWIGAYWDRVNRRLYVLPLPMLGFVVSFGRRPLTAADDGGEENHGDR